jgi:hypothetical protein
MITTILLVFIGAWLNAPGWYFVLCGLSLFTKILIYGIKMYNAGKKL